MLLLERDKDEEEERGYTGALRFIALTSVSFSTRCSQPVCHALPHHHLLLLLFPCPPLVDCESGKDGMGGAMGQNRSLFPGHCSVPSMQGHI